MTYSNKSRVRRLSVVDEKIFNELKDAFNNNNIQNDIYNLLMNKIYSGNIYVNGASIDVNTILTKMSNFKNESDFNKICLYLFSSNRANVSQGVIKSWLDGEDEYLGESIKRIFNKEYKNRMNA